MNELRKGRGEEGRKGQVSCLRMEERLREMRR